MLALDFETYPFSQGRMAPKPILISTYPGKLEVWTDKWEWPDEPGVGCNVAYDACCQMGHGHQASVWNAYAAGAVTDISIRQQLIDIEEGLGTNRSYSLASLVKRHFNEELAKDDNIRLEFHRYAGGPLEAYPEAFREYARLDAEWTYRVWEAQERRGSANVKNWEHFEAQAALALQLMSVWGIRADKAWTDRLLASAGQKFAALQDRFRSIGVLRPDGSKDKGLLQDMVVRAYHGSPPRTDKGAVKTDRLTLEESGDSVLQELTGDGPIEKIITTYGKVAQAACEAPYNSRYNVLVSSGRTSSNFQQWPRGGNNAPEEVNSLRACFIPRKGYVFCSVDYTGAELITLAQVCLDTVGWSNLAKALNEGQNLHTRLAARFAQCSYEEMVKRVKVKDPEAVNLRQAAKPVNFGLPGMMGAKRLVLAAQKDGAYFCELSGRRQECLGSSCKDCVSLAYAYVGKWKSEWPEVPLYHNWIQQQALTPFSTPRTSFKRGGLFPSEAANHPFQHLASRGAKAALVVLAKECYKTTGLMAGCRPVLFAHDEIIAELPESVAPEAGDEMARIMREAFQKWTPDVKVEAEPALMKRWWKGAQTVRDSKGRLQVWEPS